MKIVWFSHTADLAGAELSLLEGTRGLVAAGHEVHVLLPGRGRLGERLQQEGVPVSVIPYRWWIAAGAHRSLTWRARRLLRNLIAWPRIRGLLVRYRPDLAVSNTLDIPAGALAARSAGVPHVWYVHELFGKEGHGLFFDFGERPTLALMDRLSSRVLAASRVVEAQLCRWISPDKIRVVYQAVEVPAGAARRSAGRRAPGAGRRAPGAGCWVLKGGPSQHCLSPSTQHPAPGTAFRLVCVGRLTKGKRQIDAIRALSLLVREGLDVRLALVGGEDAAYGALLRSMLQELGVADRVEFVSFTEDPFSHIVSADVSLNCSVGEAFGRVTVEAMKLGRPVVGADSGGTRELIREGVNGLLYPPGDVEALARKVAVLCHDRNLRCRMGQEARAWARERFSRERYSADLQAVFEEAVAG